MEVLQECVAQEMLVGGVADNGGDRVESSFTSRARAALAHDELVGAITPVAHHDRLQHPELADAVDELSEIVLIEVCPRLARVGDDRVGIDVHEPSAGNFDEVGPGGLDRRVFMDPGAE